MYYDKLLSKKPVWRGPWKKSIILKVNELAIILLYVVLLLKAVTFAD